MAVSSLIAPGEGVGNAGTCAYMMYLFAVRVLFSDTAASNAYAQFYPRECRHDGAVRRAKSRKPDRSNDGYLAAEKVYTIDDAARASCGSQCLESSTGKLVVHSTRQQIPAVDKDRYQAS